MKKRLKSFTHAFSGWRIASKEEPNYIIHLFAALLAVSLGFYFKIAIEEWLFIVLAIAIVLASELFNTALEVLCDYIQPEKHTSIKKIKDLSAGAVLITAIAALIGGLLIFIPKINQLFYA